MNRLRKTTKLSKLGILLLAAAATGCFAGARAPVPAQPEQLSSRTYVYECNGGYEFVVQTEENQAWLFLPHQTVRLPRSRSGAGVWYRGNQISFQIKNDEAQLEVGETVHRHCRNNHAKAIWEGAKLRGVDFRGVGNEPGWIVEIVGGEAIVFISDYGQQRQVFAKPEPTIDPDARTTTYTIDDLTQTFTLVITGAPCRDTMSGEAFSATVNITVNGRTFQGCGKPLH